MSFNETPGPADKEPMTNRNSAKIFGKLILLFVLLGLQYQNCSSYNDPSPFELDSEIPFTVPADKVFLQQPNDPAYLRDTRVPDPFFSIQMDGACNVGTAAVDHRIELSLSRLDGGTYTPLMMAQDPQSCSLFSQNSSCIPYLKCEHGRYHVLINGQRSDFCPPLNNLGVQLRLTGQLVTFDANGVESRVQSGAMESSVIFTRLLSICQN